MQAGHSSTDQDGGKRRSAINTSSQIPRLGREPLADDASSHLADHPAAISQMFALSPAVISLY
jgi:hypothetical protein